uniref:helix-turn-helix domain-containing protein n=1 Tax=Rhizobium rhizoryzae TaxID=451876 RepID=UPI002897E263
ITAENSNYERSSFWGSEHVNRTLGQNISQVVNGYRIGEAQHLLSETDRSITAIMFDSGFYTKSNFNREFTRITGMTPSDYRRSAGRSNA